MASDEALLLHQQVTECADENSLFNIDMLKKLDCSKCSFAVNHGLIPTTSPSPGLVVRPLERTDFDKGYLELLSQLTKVGEYPKKEYDAQFSAMKQTVGTHYVVVVENTTQGRVVASATLLMERKFIHGAAMRGRIEDVVVDREHRGLHLGSMLVELLTLLSREVGSYKTTLDCKPDKIGFYEKFGYWRESQVLMVQRFFE